MRYHVKCRLLIPHNHSHQCQDISATSVFPRSNKERQEYRYKNNALPFRAMPSATSSPSPSGLRKWKRQPSEGDQCLIKHLKFFAPEKPRVSFFTSWIVAHAISEIGRLSVNCQTRELKFISSTKALISNHEAGDFPQIFKRSLPLISYEICARRREKAFTDA